MYSISCISTSKAIDEDFVVTWEESGSIMKEKRFILGDLVREIARISPGQKITYITDVIGSPENREKITSFAKGADHLFIEAVFMDRDKEIAKRKYHLTAREAGELARKSRAKHFTLFHFSPRYNHMAEDIQKEAMEAFLRN